MSHSVAKVSMYHCHYRCYCCCFCRRAKNLNKCNVFWSFLHRNHYHHIIIYHHNIIHHHISSYRTCCCVIIVTLLLLPVSPLSHRVCSLTIFFARTHNSIACDGPDLCCWHSPPFSYVTHKCMNILLLVVVASSHGSTTRLIRLAYKIWIGKSLSFDASSHQLSFFPLSFCVLRCRAILFVFWIYVLLRNFRMDVLRHRVNLKNSTHLLFRPRFSTPKSSELRL